MTKTATKTADASLFGAPQGEQTVMPPEAKDEPAPKAKAAKLPAVQKGDNPFPVTPPAPVSEVEQMIAMFERAIRDPAVDVTKAREIMAMRKELAAERSQQIFNEAMAAAQAEIVMVGVDKPNPQTKSRYASYPALDRAIRPIYARHGFALSFDTEDGAPADSIRVVCFVSCAGHIKKYRLDMPADGKGAKGGDVMTKTHATGSGVSYGMRYLLKMIFNIATGEDDDGNKAGKKTETDFKDVVLITKEQMQTLAKAITWCGVPERTVCQTYGIEKIPDLPAARFEDAMVACRNYATNNPTKVKGKIDG